MLLFDVDFTAELWESTSAASWMFVSLPARIADDIDERIPARGGFGSIGVAATIGGTTWDTSIFPDKKLGTFVLPVKRQVRDVEGVSLGDKVSVRLRIEVDRTVYPSGRSSSSFISCLASTSRMLSLEGIWSNGGGACDEAIGTPISLKNSGWWTTGAYRARRRPGL